MKTHYTDNGYLTVCKRKVKKPGRNAINHTVLHAVNDWSKVNCSQCLRVKSGLWRILSKLR